MKKHITIKNRNHIITFFLSLLLFFSVTVLKAQQSKKVLFLGNSYTGVNNLPQIISDIALSTGDTLNFESNTPGGYQLIDHSINMVSQNKIANGGWDYIVLQGQSQEPITASNDFGNGFSALYDSIRQYNSCTVIMPYMTWGRKNGDASNCAAYPEMCSYQGMDTTLRDKYLTKTAFVNGEVSPVSVVWNHLRQNYPNIELYQVDESHPSAAGSYAAACCFYASIFKKDPELVSYNFGLDTTEAAIIRNAAKTIVFDNLTVWDYMKLPIANFSYTIGSGINEVSFSPNHTGFIRQNYFWDFGDGNTSNLSIPSHSYSSNGTYTVKLTTTNCDLQGLHTSIKDTIIQFCSHTPIVSASNPWLCKNDTLWTQEADTYQWLSYGIPIPETNQYLPNYSMYGSSGFSVISTVSACTELSETYSETPQWSGYYFDALGDPCDGDTVAFSVLHNNGFLSGSETILWYKNNTLLVSMTNEDTLLINSSGAYECKVINPNSNCPIDTTSYFIEYDCEVIGIEDINDYQPNSFWTMFPNPAFENITISFTENTIRERIQVQNIMGQIVKEKEATGTTIINISDLRPGIYFIRLKDNKRPALKCIKL